MKDKIKIRELIDLKSLLSSMRWAFYHTIRLGWAITVITVLAIVANAWLGPDHQINIGALTTLNGVVYGIAVGGKVGQSFSPNDTAPTAQASTSPEPPEQTPPA